MPGGEERLPAPEDLNLLVLRALHDRTLRNQAFAANLDQPKLLAYLTANPPPRLDSAALDERAALEAAEAELAMALSAREALGFRIRFLRQLGILLTLMLCGAAVGGAVAFATSGRWLPFAAIVVGAATLVVFGIAVLRPSSPVVFSTRRARADLTVRDAREAVEDADLKLTNVLVETEIRPALRTYLNSLPDDQYRTALTLVEQEGLAELEDPRYAIPTRARNELDRFLDDMPGGSIGLAGPRGVGKTTLIRSVCPTVSGGTSDRFGVVVAAPVKFDSREFLLHLFAEVCRAVLGPRAVAELRTPDPISRVISRNRLDVLVTLAMVAAPLLGALLIVEAFVSWKSLTHVVLGTLLIAGGLFTAQLQWAARRHEAYRSQQSRRLSLGFRSRESATDGLDRTAADLLEQIWFQQTYTTGWSGGLKAGVAEAAVEGGRELSRSQMTLPDVVAEFRRLLTEIAKRREVRIGIDELDKLESRDDAYRFMNEMKVLFGLDECFFLISVSEDAMSVFERRGLPFRDVFDSSFDDVVNVGYLDLDESIELLQRRVVGLPLPFAFLCHCVAGGLARDVIRVAREVIASNPSDGSGWPVHLACQGVVEADVRAKVAASLVATRRMTPCSQVEDLRSWLQELRTVEVDAAGLSEVCEAARPPMFSRLEVASAAGAADSPRTLAAELLTFIFYSATLLELFDETTTADDYREAQADGRVEKLAHARQAMAVHPQTAWESIRSLREGTPMQHFPAAVAG
jgi:Cdc6-like AAA superfamily ATPase